MKTDPTYFSSQKMFLRDDVICSIVTKARLQLSYFKAYNFESLICSQHKLVNKLNGMASRSSSMLTMATEVNESMGDIHHCRGVGLCVTWWPRGHGLSFSFGGRDLSYMRWVCMKQDLAVAKSCLHLAAVTAANDL